MSHSYRSALIPEVPLPGKKNGGSSLARAPAICPESWGEGHRAKSLIGYAFTRKVANRGDEISKIRTRRAVPAQPRNATTRDQLQFASHPLCATRYQFDCGAFTV